MCCKITGILETWLFHLVGWQRCTFNSLGVKDAAWRRGSRWGHRAILVATWTATQQEGRMYENGTNTQECCANGLHGPVIQSSEWTVILDNWSAGERMHTTGEVWNSVRNSRLKEKIWLFTPSSPVFGRHTWAGVSHSTKVCITQTPLLNEELTQRNKIQKQTNHHHLSQFSCPVVFFIPLAITLDILIFAQKFFSFFLTAHWSSLNLDNHSLWGKI